jgi:hypothetical protein
MLLITLGFVHPAFPIVFAWSVRRSSSADRTCPSLSISAGYFIYLRRKGVRTFSQRRGKARTFCVEVTSGHGSSSKGRRFEPKSPPPQNTSEASTKDFDRDVIYSYVTWLEIHLQNIYSISVSLLLLLQPAFKRGYALSRERRDGMQFSPRSFAAEEEEEEGSSLSLLAAIANGNKNRNPFVSLSQDWSIA